jgi:hypothetical protein
MDSNFKVLIAAGMTSPALRDAALQGATSHDLAQSCGHGEDNKSY